MCERPCKCSAKVLKIVVCHPADSRTRCPFVKKTGQIIFFRNAFLKIPDYLKLMMRFIFFRKMLKTTSQDQNGTRQDILVFIPDSAEPAGSVFPPVHILWYPVKVPSLRPVSLVCSCGYPAQTEQNRSVSYSSACRCS